MTKAKVMAIDLEKIRKRIRVAIVFGFTMIAILAILSTAVFAQDFKTLPVDDAFTGANSSDKIKAANGIVKAAEGTGNLGAQGELYMLGYWIPRMTQTDRTTLSSLGRYRVAFLKKFMNKKMARSGRQNVIRKLLPSLTEIAGDKGFHKAVRVNAITLIGMLYDDQRTKWPSPSPAAYNALKQILRDAGSEDFMKVAAISGIANFAEVSRGAKSTVVGNDIQADLIAIIRGTATGQDQWSDDLNYWMKRRATQILGHVGDGTQVAVSVGVMKGQDLKVDRNDFWLRYDGLDALRNLKFDTVPPAEIPKMIDEVLEFAAFSMERESKWLEAEVEDLVYTNILWNDQDLNQKRRRRAGGGGGGGGGRTPGGGGGLGDEGTAGGGPGRGGFGGGDRGGFGGGDRGGFGGGDRGGFGGGDRGGFGGGGRGGQAPEMESDKVELPVFMLNESRARVKAVMLSARDFLKVKDGGGVLPVADAATKTRIDDEIYPLIVELLEETELGVIDYRKLKDNDPDTKNVTARLQEIYASAAENLRGLKAKSGNKTENADEVFQ